MSMRYQAGFLTASYNGLKVPDAPTIGTATAGNTTASVTFTPPTNVGGSAITGYTVISSPSGITGTGLTSPITVSGLANGTAYTFKVVATNAYGTSPLSAATNSVTPNTPQQVVYATPGTYSFVAPAGLSPATVSVVCVGGGGKAGGTSGGAGGAALAYKNNISVTSAVSYTVVVGAGATSAYPAVGGNSSFTASFGTVTAGGGQSGENLGNYGGGGFGGSPSGTYDGGGNGGQGGSSAVRTDGNYNGAGGGGAGGYAGTGGTGGSSSNTASASAMNGTAGAGGGGGGGGGGHDTLGYGYGYGGGGGGVGLLGQGTNGTAGAGRVNNIDPTPGVEGGGGSGGGSGSDGFADYGYNADGTISATSSGGQYGGGGGNGYRAGGQGGVRIIYSTLGVTRAFPSTNTGDL